MGETKSIGMVGLGDMGSALTDKLYSKGYSLVLYNRTKDRCSRFEGMPRIQIADSLGDLAKRLESQEGPSTVWLMVKGGQPTNGLVAELSGLMQNNDVVMDGSNSRYTDSIENYDKLRSNGIHYLDVGCAGGPSDIPTGVSLMVGGDRAAFDRSKSILMDIAGNGGYGYVGGSGSGHKLKLIHNLIFYGIFPVYSEAAALLDLNQTGPTGFDIDESLRLLESSPPINHDIMAAIRKAFKHGDMLNDAPPQINVSEAVRWFDDNMKSLGAHLPVTDAILGMYSSMPERCRLIYSKAKRIITGH